MEVQIVGLSGAVCSIYAQRTWTAADVKEAVQVSAGIPMQQQRLLFQSEQLADEEQLPILSSPGTLQLTLVRTSLPEEDWQTRVQEDWYALDDAPRWAQSDRAIVLAAVRNNGLALQFASDQLQADPEIVLVALCQNVCAVEYAEPQLWGIRTFVLAAVKQNGLMLLSAAEELRGDWEIALAAVAQNEAAFRMVAWELRTNREFILQAVRLNGMVLRLAPHAWRSDLEIIQEAVRQNPAAQPHVPDDTRGLIHPSAKYKAHAINCLSRASDLQPAV